MLHIVCEKFWVVVGGTRCDEARRPMSRRGMRWCGVLLRRCKLSESASAAGFLDAVNDEVRHWRRVMGLEKLSLASSMQGKVRRMIVRLWMCKSRCWGVARAGRGTLLFLLQNLGGFGLGKTLLDVGGQCRVCSAGSLSRYWVLRSQPVLRGGAGRQYR